MIIKTIFSLKINSACREIYLVPILPYIYRRSESYFIVKDSLS